MRRPTSAATDATLTIEPPPRAAIPGIACLQQRNVPRALTAKTFSQTSSGVSGAFVVEPMPGDVDEHVEVGHRRRDLLPRRARRARPPSHRARSATACGERSATISSAPSAARLRATAAPMPEPAPVTRARFPVEAHAVDRLTAGAPRLPTRSRRARGSARRRRRRTGAGAAARLRAAPRSPRRRARASGSSASTSIAIVSPSRTIASGPPRAASGATWPTISPRVAPEKRPSVTSATDSPSPAPTTDAVTLSISRMPGPPAGPS